MNELSTRIGDWLIAGLIGLVLGVLGMKWWDAGHPSIITHIPIQKVPVHVNVKAAPAAEAAGVAIEPVAVKTVYVYKDEAKKNLNLPKDIQDAPQQKVISASTVESDEHAQTVTTVLDTATGENQVLVQAEPLPWFAADHKREASIGLLEKLGGPVIRVQARQDIFQVKAVHFHVMAGGDVPVPIFGMSGRPDAYVGVGVHAGW